MSILCYKEKCFFPSREMVFHFNDLNNTPYFAVHYEKMYEDTFISVKIQTFVHKLDSITIFAF